MEKQTKRGKGKPKSFESAEHFLLCVEEYLKYCIDQKKFPNIAGFCVFKDGKHKCFRIHKDTFYKQKEYYSDAYSIASDMLEDGVLQDNTYRAQLYLKNKFGYVDKQQLESKVEAHNTNVNIDADYDQLKAKATPDELERIAKGTVSAVEVAEIMRR